jgi:hypothetical protein
VQLCVFETATLPERCDDVLDEDLDGLYDPQDPDCQ